MRPGAESGHGAGSRRTAGWAWPCCLRPALVTKLIQPDFGASGLDSLARAALPFALATVGMAIVVIAGGIDLSIAAMMAVASVTAAVLMEGATDAAVGPCRHRGPCPRAALMGAINGSLIVVTRVPDIVVTLAMLFVWQGVALLILNAPGGRCGPWLRGDGGGPRAGLTDWLPRAVVFLAGLHRRDLAADPPVEAGPPIYAIGSDPLAAFRSGVPVGQTRIAPMPSAASSPLGGLSVTMGTGIGEPIPGPYLLASVAAVVLGGVVLGGGRAGSSARSWPSSSCALVRLDLTLLSVDPNVAAIIEGTIMVAVVMFGAVLATRGGRT
jgi:ribose transport system permease protein